MEGKALLAEPTTDCAGTNYIQWQPYEEAGTNVTFRFLIKAQQTSGSMAVS